MNKSIDNDLIVLHYEMSTCGEYLAIDVECGNGEASDNIHIGDMACVVSEKFVQTIAEANEWSWEPKDETTKYYEQ